MDQEFNLDSALDSAMGVTEESQEQLDNAIDNAVEEPVADNAAPVLEPDDDIPMPQSWKKDWEPDWKATPRTARERFLEREKQMLTGLEQYKTHAGFGRTMQEALNPFMPYLQERGIEPARAVQALLNAQKMLEQNPEQALRNLAQQYKVNLFNQQQEAGESVHPAIQAALDRVARVESTLTQAQEREYQARMEATRKEVDAFFSDPKNVYADEVADDIATLVKAGMPLAEAYEKAVWANPVTRQKEIARVQKEQAEELRKKTMEAAKAAKKSTSVNVRARDTGRTPTEGKASLANLDEALRETQSEIRTRNS